MLKCLFIRRFPIEVPNFQNSSPASRAPLRTVLFSLSHVSAATCSSSLSRAHVVHLFGIISSTRGRTQPLTATPAHGVLGSWHPASLSLQASRAEPSLSLQALNAEPLQARFRRALSSLGQTGVLLRLQGNTVSFMRSMWSRGSGVTRVYLH